MSKKHTLTKGRPSNPIILTQFKQFIFHLCLSLPHWTMNNVYAVLIRVRNVYHTLYFAISAHIWQISLVLAHGTLQFSRWLLSLSSQQPFCNRCCYCFLLHPFYAWILLDLFVRVSYGLWSIVKLARSLPIGTTMLSQINLHCHNKIWSLHCVNYTHTLASVPRIAVYREREKKSRRCEVKERKRMF